MLLGYCNNRVGYATIPCIIILCAAGRSFGLTSPMLQDYLKKKECANVRPRTIAPFRALVQPNIAYSFLSEASSSSFDAVISYFEHLNTHFKRSNYPFI
jgi:hypothetical protein